MKYSRSPPNHKNNWKWHNLSLTTIESLKHLKQMPYFNFFFFFQKWSCYIFQVCLKFTTHQKIFPSPLEKWKVRLHIVRHAQHESFKTFSEKISTQDAHQHLNCCFFSLSAECIQLLSPQQGLTGRQLYLNWEFEYIIKIPLEIKK